MNLTYSMFWVRVEHHAQSLIPILLHSKGTPQPIIQDQHKCESRARFLAPTMFRVRRQDRHRFNQILQRFYVWIRIVAMFNRAATSQGLYVFNRFPIHRVRSYLSFMSLVQLKQYHHQDVVYSRFNGHQWPSHRGGDLGTPFFLKTIPSSWEEAGELSCLFPLAGYAKQSTCASNENATDVEILISCVHPP